MDSVLVVAAWGFPPSWSRYHYRIRIDHPGLAGQPLEGESCSSTLVVVSYLRSLGRFEVSTMVFGLDTVVDPTIVGEKLRDAAAEHYRRWLDELIKTCEVCSSIDASMFDVVILPGVGAFYGYRFNGSIVHLFNKAFIHIVERLNSKRYGFIVLDLTHGINYQAVAVLYATVAGVIAAGMERNLERRLIIMNSEPAAGGRDRCIKQDQRQPPSPPNVLNVLDVTELQRAVSFIRVLYSVRSFAVKPLETVLREELKRRSGTGQPERGARSGGASGFEAVLEGRLIPFFKLLGNCVFGPTYGEAYVAGGAGREVKPVGINICRYVDEIGAVGPGDVEYKPVRVDHERKIVEYELASISVALTKALKLFVQSVCSQLESGDLIDYLGKVSDYMDREGGLYGRLVAEEVRETLGSIAKYVTLFRDTLPERHARVEADGSIIIDAVLFRALSEMKYKAVESIRRGENLISRKDLEEALRKAEERQRQEMDRLRRAEEVDVITVRNMVAHGGLEYTVLRELVVKDGRVLRIVYDEELLRKILGRLLE